MQVMDRKDCLDDQLLPSQITHQKFIRRPAVDKVIENDAEWKRECGKWLVKGFRDFSELDSTWKDLQCLVEDNTLLMIKSSTAQAELVSGRKTGVVICYTRSDRAKEAADAIRGKLVGNDHAMLYRPNSWSFDPFMPVYDAAHKADRFEGYQYMNTPLGRFYKKNGNGEWTLVRNEEDRGKAIDLKNFSYVRPYHGNDASECVNLMVRAEKLKPEFSFFKDHWKLTYYRPRVLNHVRSFREGARQLFDAGIFPRITEDETKREYVFRFYVLPGEGIPEILKCAVELRKRIFFPHPIFFYEDVCEQKFMQTAENEFFEMRHLPGFGEEWRAVPWEE